MRVPSTASGSTGRSASAAHRRRAGCDLMANPSISVHLSSEAEAIILEGTAEYVSDPAHPLAAPAMASSRDKYPQYYSNPETPFRPFWALRPATAFAWTLKGFPQDATRWRFPGR